MGRFCLVVFNTLPPPVQDGGVEDLVIMGQDYGTIPVSRSAVPTHNTIYEPVVVDYPIHLFTMQICPIRFIGVV